MMSRSSWAFRSLTWAPAFSTWAARLASICRTVTGSNGGLPGPSAKRSSTPKGEAANFSSGGMGPVLTLSGKLAALPGLRPEASTRPGGSSSVNAVDSGSGAAKCRLLTSASSAASSLSNWAL